MGFGDLKKLGKKENRIYLVLVLWLFIGFLVSQFYVFLGSIIYAPLLFICLALFFVAVFSKKEVRELTKKEVLKSCLIVIPIILILSFVSIVLFTLSILSYILITSLFTMHGCYEAGVNWDEKLFNTPWILRVGLRTVEFVGGLLLSMGILLVVSIITTIIVVINPGVANLLAWIPWIILTVEVGLTLFSLLFLLIGRFNAWLGIFFIDVAFYTLYLMLKAYLSFSEGPTEYLVEIQIVLFIIDTVFLLYTISKLVGKRAEILSDTLKFFKTDTILIWLIFSKATYEFIIALPGTQADLVYNVSVFILFLPLLVLMGLYGMFKHGKVKAGWKEKAEKEKKAKKKEDKPESKDIQKGPSSGTIICTQCGSSSDRTAKFCSNCGAGI